MSNTFAQVNNAAHQGAFGNNPIPEPSLKQLAAGNYKKGSFSLHGLNIAIENPAFTYRRGQDKNGQTWSCLMQAAYGYIKGTTGADGDAVDCFVGHVPEETTAYIINQKGQGGFFDEHKVMLGFLSQQQAVDTYQHCFERGWTGLMSVVPCTIEQLKWWLANGDKSRPVKPSNLPYAGLERMDSVVWGGTDGSNLYSHNGLVHNLMYQIRQSDTLGHALEPMRYRDMIEELGNDGFVYENYDALIVEYNKLERKSKQLLMVMQGASDTVKPVGVTVSKPLTKNGVANVIAWFEMDDGQAVGVFFHNPDKNPKKLDAQDEMISYKWVLNKKDITIAVAPENGKDIVIRTVAKRIMQLVEKNHDRFMKANSDKAELNQKEQELGTLVIQKQTQLDALNEDIKALEAQKAEKEARTSGEQLLNTGYDGIKAELKGMAWVDDPIVQGGLVKSFIGAQESGDANPDGILSISINRNGVNIAAKVGADTIIPNSVELIPQYGIDAQSTQNYKKVADKINNAVEAYVAKQREAVNTVAVSPVVEPESVAEPNQTVGDYLKDNYQGDIDFLLERVAIYKSASQKSTKKELKDLMIGDLSYKHSMLKDDIKKDAWMMQLIDLAVNDKLKSLAKVERPLNWLTNLANARAVAKSLSIETKGKKLERLVKDIGIYDENEVKKELLAEFKALASRLVLPKGYVFDLSDAEKSIGDITRWVSPVIKQKGAFDFNKIRIELRAATRLNEYQGDVGISDNVFFYTDDKKTKAELDKLNYQRYGDMGASNPTTPKAIVEKMEQFLTKAVFPQIEYLKVLNSTNVDVSKLSEIGIAEITDIGDENLYFEKDGKYYVSKVGNPQLYALGEWDFAKYPDGKPTANVEQVSEPNLSTSDIRRSLIKSFSELARKAGADNVIAGSAQGYATAYFFDASTKKTSVVELDVSANVLPPSGEVWAFEKHSKIEVSDGKNNVIATFSPSEENILKAFDVANEYISKQDSQPKSEPPTENLNFGISFLQDALLKDKNKNKVFAFYLGDSDFVTLEQRGKWELKVKGTKSHTTSVTKPFGQSVTANDDAKVFNSKDEAERWALDNGYIVLQAERSGDTIKIHTLQPESEQPMTNHDRDYLQSIIDGKADLSNADEIEAKLTDISERLDADLEPLFEQAAEAFAQYAIAQAATV